MFAGSRKEPTADRGACFDAQALGLLHRLGSNRRWVIMSQAENVEGVYSHGG